MQKNEIITVKVESYGAFGEGVAHADGSVIFVPYAMQGEVVSVQILAIKKGVVYAKLVNVLEKSNQRREPFCPHFTKCGGCDIQHVVYSEQLEIKKEQVSGCIKRIAKIDDFSIKINPSKYEQGSRNKLTMPFGISDGKIVLGFFSERSHRVVAVKCCPLGAKADLIIEIFTDWANKFNLSVYDESTEKGLLRAISVRNYGERYMFTLVASKEKVPHIDDLVQKLNSEFDEPVIYLNVNSKKTNVVLGDKNIHLSGAKKLKGSALDVEFELSPFSFAQVNDYVRDCLYQKVLSFVDADDTVIDAYSGAGLMSVLLAKKAKRVYGAEIVPDAVKDADYCAEQNGVKDKVINKTGDCALLVPEIVKEIGRADNLTVVLDPPRKGCDQKVLESVMNANAKKIVYVSCNPATLARDLSILKEKYELQSVEIFDMFPDTKHVESLVCLTRQTN